MRKQYRLVFVHGWGFSKDFWSLLQNHLHDFAIDYVDLGFVNNTPTTHVLIHNILEQQYNYIAVGHSLGLLYLLKSFPCNFHHYVAINSFLRFSKANTYTSGVPIRILQRMSKAIDKNVDSVLSEFYQQCQFSDKPPNIINSIALQNGLEWLEKEDFRDFLPQLYNKLTILASDHDPVVSREMTIDSFKTHPIHWIQDNTHILPFTQPDFCATIIRNIALTS